MLKLFLYTDASYYESYALPYMVWANVQISNNTFQKNIGWQLTRGVIEAYCFSDDIDYPFDSYIFTNNIPNASYSDINYIKSKQGVVSFTIVDNVILPSSLLAIDTNKFLLINNVYDTNFISGFRSLNEFMNFRRIHMISETYVRNTGQTCESLNKYGSIKSICNVSKITAYSNMYLYTYYGTPGNNDTLIEKANINHVDEFYPRSPVLIRAALYVYIEKIEFDNTNGATNNRIFQTKNVGYL